MLTEAQLQQLEDLAASVPGYPWHAYVEGRDMLSGSSFILAESDTSGTGSYDLYVDRGVGLAHSNCLDFVAELRTVLPLLIAQVRAIRSGAREEIVESRKLTRLDTLSYVCDPPPWRISKTESGADVVVWIESQLRDGSTEQFAIRGSDPRAHAAPTLIVEMRNSLPALLSEISLARPMPSDARTGDPREHGDE